LLHIILATHGELGRALLEAAEEIAGPQERVYAVGLLAGESPEGFAAQLDAALAQTAGGETLLLVDLFGGTPYNYAARAALAAQPPGRVVCVTGANLPLLLELLLGRNGDAPLAELVERAVQAGRDSIRDLSAALRRSA